MFETIFTDIKPFDLEIIAESGQAFRWNRYKDGYIGVIDSFVIKAKQEAGNLRITFNGGQEHVDYIRNYFGLDKDYKDIESRLMEFEELIPAVSYCSGNRILSQDPWETTISFIISANNSIGNIKNTIELLCKFYGNPIEIKGVTYYTFPTPETLSNLTEEDLKSTRCGYRAKYIIRTAKMIGEGKVNLSNLKKLPTDAARRELIKLPGVGPKVSDCILLYSLGKYDAFPIDVWIKRAMNSIYFKGKKVSLEKMRNFARERYKDLAGFAQQYLFYYIRNNYNKE